MAKCQMHPGTLAGPCCCRCPEIGVKCQPSLEKLLKTVYSSCVSGIMENHAHIWLQASPLTTLFQHQQMWTFSGVCWDQGASTVSTKCPFSSGTAFPCVAQESPRCHCAPGDSPFPSEHHQLSSCRVAAFAFPLFTVLMELKPSPFSFFSFSPFSLVPAAVSNFPLSLQCFWGGVLFLYSPPLPSLRPLSARKSGCLPSAVSRSPNSLLLTAYLLNSVVQVVQIVVLILQSVF